MALVSARDSNLVVSLDGEFDLSKQQNMFDVRGGDRKGQFERTLVSAKTRLPLGRN